jgi:hypothetical protein
VRWRLAQLEAVVLLGYGLILTAVKLLVQAFPAATDEHPSRQTVGSSGVRPLTVLGFGLPKGLLGAPRHVASNRRIEEAANDLSRARGRST